MTETRIETRGELRVSIAVGAALLVQTAAALLWAGAAAERLSELERRAVSSAVLIERTARLEEQTRAVRASVERIEAKLDRLEAEPRP
jgi:ubiquinone biosynthesis protein UbiJ